jgi:hypothetical protein
MEIKKEDEVIIDGSGYTYLSEFMNDLPENVMLNKVTTGCGMTSVVLNNKIKYVLAVPYVSLIENKLKWCKEKGVDICAIYGGNGEKEVLEFNGRKIITTYDSLGKVTRALEVRGDIKDWKICIDEAHKLVDSAAFRTNAVRTVLDSYTNYKAYVFGTATPVKDKYQLPRLQHIKKARIIWENLSPVNVNYCQYDTKINDVGALIAIDFLQGVRLGNAHIFINSVSSICSIIRKMKKGGFDKPDQIRIVCANNDGNDHIIKQKLTGSYFNSLVSSDVKKVNFYTATAFEGCDIYDEDGKNFIITDGTKDHTKIDITTVLPQIIGRVRNSKYKNVVNLLYTPNQYLSSLTEVQFEENVKNEIKKARHAVETFNKEAKGSMVRQALLKDTDNSYLIVDEDKIHVNEEAWYNEMHNFSALKETYFVSNTPNNCTIQNGIKNNNGLKYAYKGIDKIEIKGFNKIKLGQKSSFKDSCKDYIDAKENGYFKYWDGLEVSLIEEAYEKLGGTKMKALEYKKSKIQEEIMRYSNMISNEVKIVTCLKLKAGQWVSKAQIKKWIQNIYNNLGLKLKAKATDLKKWYDVDDKNSRLSGKLESGFVIKACKIKLK